LAFTAFLAGGITLIVASRAASAPFRWLWAALGTVALAATALGVLFLEWAPIAELGKGGIERWIVYPIVLWLVAFGSYLLGARHEGAATRGATSRCWWPTGQAGRHRRDRGADRRRPAAERSTDLLALDRRAPERER
jgi:hypothetical protein